MFFCDKVILDILDLLFWNRMNGFGIKGFNYCIVINVMLRNGVINYFVIIIFFEYCVNYFGYLLC